MHAVNCVERDGKIDQVGRRFSDSISWRNTGKERIDRRISLTVYIATINYINVYENAVCAEHIHRIFRLLIMTRIQVVIKS